MTLSAYRKAPSYANEASLSASPACRPGPLQMPEAGTAPTNATSFTHASYPLWLCSRGQKGYECAAGGRCNLLVCSCLPTSPPCDVPWPTPILHGPVPDRHHFIRRLQGRLPPLELPSASAHANTASFHENTRTVVAIRSAAKPVSHVFCVYVK